MMDEIEIKLHRLAEQVRHNQKRDALKTARRIYEDLVIANYSDRMEELFEVQPDLNIDPVQALSVVSKETTKAESTTINDVFSARQRLALNDRIAFINHLFMGDENAFSEVLKALEGRSSSEAIQYLEAEIKPKYGNWEGKEPYEQRLMNWILKM